jgi:hypothetical protein
MKHGLNTDQAELGTNMVNHLKRYRGGKRRLGRRAFTGLRDQEIGKWRSFSHLKTALTRLFPLKSTQVVDFPHLAYAGVFWGVHEIGISGQAELGTNIEEAEII